MIVFCKYNQTIVITFKKTQTKLWQRQNKTHKLIKYLSNGHCSELFQNEQVHWKQVSVPWLGGEVASLKTQTLSGEKVPPDC